MSKKDLLERLTRAPADPTRTRREEEAGAPGRPVDSTQQTRMGTRVVRRRRVEGADEAPPPATTTVVRRRAAVTVGEEPAPARGPLRRPRAEDDPGGAHARGEAPDDDRVEAQREEPAAPAERAPAESDRDAVRTEPEPVRAEPVRDEPGRAAGPATETPASAEPAEVSARAGREQPEPPRDEAGDGSAAAPVSPVREPVAEPERPAARRDDAEERPQRPERREPVRAVRSEERAARDDGPPPREIPAGDDRAERVPMAASGGEAGEAVGRQLPETPRYAGLGKAVVMPPPGYDPTNPAAFRRKQEAERATAAVDQRRAPTRRRVDTPGDFGGGRPEGPPARRRRGPGAPSGGRMMERPVRTKRRMKSGPKASSPTPKAQKRKIKIDNTISVGQLAHELGVKAPVVIRQLMGLGVMASITEMLDLDTAVLVASEFDYEVENVGFQEHNYLEVVADEAESEGAVPRPPVVTIMGHVDHGKTTLLDTIRTSRVAQGEAGGITQHIGAYQVDTEKGTVTFIDTPGHAAFTAMRARGAEVTDIVVLVVAADDGVQPQTLEAINHAKAAQVPILVAVNKMDKPGASPDAIMSRLAELELVPEQWGGDTMFVPISALKNEGIDELLEGILLQAEVLDLRANPDRFAEGVVLEAKMERGRGAVATVLVQQGTLKRGDHVVLGSAYGKVRAIVSGSGEQVKEAGPSTPVELFGLSELPEVGDSVHAVKNEQNARTLAEHRANAKRELAMSANRRATAEDLYARASQASRESMLVILKADVGGSLQALKSAIEAIQIEGAECRILYSGVGDVTESDVNSAAAEGAQIIGFNVKLDAKARQAASQLGVEAEFYTVIYDVLDRVTRGMKGLLAPVYEQVRMGTVEVRQLFKISKSGTIAGSYVVDGKVARNHSAKVLRDGAVIWEGKIQSLRRFKDDVREVAAGYECGVSLDGFENLATGDLIETYAEQIVEPT